MASSFVETALIRLGILRDRDSSFAVFGSSSHRYQLATCLPTSLIERFEARHSVVLPADYRDYLRLMGNGGAGPSYGVFPLGKMDDGDELGLWGPESVRPDLPFPFTAAKNDKSILEEGAPTEEAFPTREDYFNAYDQWSEENQQRFEEYHRRHWLVGAVPLAHHGCALRSWLVVAPGPEHGHVWEDHTAEERGVRPFESAASKRATFSDWYLDWLSRATREVAGLA